MQAFSINFCKRCYEDLNSKNNKGKNKKYCDECLKLIDKENEKGAKKMGSKYTIRTEEVRKFPLGDEATTDYHLNNILEVIKLVIKKRKNIIFITRNFY